MPRPQSISDDQISLRLQSTFRRKGFDGASLAELASESGLAKAGLYHRFPGGKREMAESVLDGLKAWMTQWVLDPLNAPGDARAKLEDMVKMLRKLYVNGTEPCLVGQFSVGGGLEHFQPRLGNSLLALQKGIAATLIQHGIPRQEAARRAEDAVVRIQGSLVLARAQDDPGPFLRTMRRLPNSLLGDL